MPGQAVIVISFPEPENDMELGSIIEVLKNAFEGREPRPHMFMGVNNVADRVISVFSPLYTPAENGEAMVEKVPLVIYQDGKRIVIGEAEVDGDQVKATITDNDMANRLGVSDVSHFSVGDPDTETRISDIDAARIKRRNVFDPDKE